MTKLHTFLLISLLAATVGLATAKDVEGHVYRSQNGNESVALISETEVARSVSGIVTQGTYVREKNNLHLTLSAQGVPFKTSYRVIKEGLLAHDGKVLFSKQPPQHENVEEVPLVIGPREPGVKFPAPPYPPTARANHVEGTVVMAITVDDQGKVTDAAVRESSGNHELDMYTKNWVLARWHYPKGKPAIYRMPFIFRLGSDDKQNSTSSNKPTGTAADKKPAVP
ncbi:energy transducer TonB [Roseimicrobium sp. ORNL1]|uniref:energy transducer TonB n=1 Tax=Roseimicrobium sp. ORNL1 TaxID=2711231 RepID=UPI0013E1A09C|nr:energy transducer TonB [Roseimicrobium sp. ORNL1]QIF03400.1 energy transducer TonB [Roseimicrobium sp. ORNL1]